MSIAKPFTFVANTYAKASEVNANFDTVYSQVNSNISQISQNAVDIENLENNKADINGSSVQRFAVADAITNSDAINKQSLTKAIGNSLNYIDGYTIAKDSGSPDDTIIVASGSCYDSTKTIILNKNSSTTKQNLNQGANATYYVYVIGSDSGSSVDVLISLNSTTPSLPTGYTKYRLIGNYTTDSNSHISIINGYSNSALFNYYGIMPDWSKMVSKVVNTLYTADKRGWIQSMGATGYTEIGVLINNNFVAYTQALGSNDTSGYGCMVPVDIGDTYICQGGVLINFIPCKGEV